MEGYTSDDEFESNSLSTEEVSECESSSSGFSRPHYNHDEAGTSNSPLPDSPVLPTPNIVIPDKMTSISDTNNSEVELMKERFAKLLLGEDMSGGGKGVCTALAISNAISNLSVSVFGELWKLEPLTPQKKYIWHREMDWLLCVSDSIVELTPSIQEYPGSGAFEVMVSRPRSDLYVNLPALKKLDTMLLSILDGFHNSEFYYVDPGIVASDDTARIPLSSSSSGRAGSTSDSGRQKEKWWVPFPKVRPNGLSDDARRRLQQCRECCNQILKAALAINANVLAQMEVPKVYLQSLPKSGKACLGEIIYRYMTADKFSPECLLDYLDLSSEYTTLEIANRIEASIHIWKQKHMKRSINIMVTKPCKSSWGGMVKGFSSDTERSKLLAHRAETLLHNLKMRFPALPQTILDLTKIQNNKDVGHSILESYSRVLESLAFNIMARVDDLLYIDDATKRRATIDSMCLYDPGAGRVGNSNNNVVGALPFPRQKQALTSSSSFASSRPKHPPTPIQAFHSRTQMGVNPVRRTNSLSIDRINSTSDTEDEKFDKHYAHIK
ncbi:hypothetical protein F8388_012469 [Cannabis sativa]|uniref:PRONE domain-containing protein n=1 Tax=Cannabis sativa TaxID=3483 RepID=A0A7J6GZU1_CANSA|nr:hypothetical protein F8388_012469 [Cannabis sativa]